MSINPGNSVTHSDVDQRWHKFVTELEQMAVQLRRVEEVEFMRTSNALMRFDEPLLLPNGVNTTMLPITKDELIYCFTSEQCNTAMVSLGIPLPSPNASLVDRRRLIGRALGVIC